MINPIGFRRCCCCCRRRGYLSFPLNPLCFQQVSCLPVKLKKKPLKSCLRCQLLKLREQVSELKEERRSLLELLNTQKTDQAEAKREIMSSLAKLKANFSTQRKKDYQQQRDEYEQKLKKAAESESKSAERIRELEKQLEESSNAQLCQICFEHPRDCIIMPCTHLLYCRACVAEHKRSGANRCPTCRGPISGEILCNINHSS